MLKKYSGDAYLKFWFSFNLIFSNYSARIIFSQTQGGYQIIFLYFPDISWHLLRRGWMMECSDQFVNILFPFCIVSEQKTASIVQPVAWLTVIFIFFCSWHLFNFTKPPSGNFLVLLHPTSLMTHELIQGREQWSVRVILVVWLRDRKYLCHCAIA